MIGNGYWATGITVTYYGPEQSADGRPAWAGRVDFYDDGFANDRPSEGRISTEGRLHTRYRVYADDMVSTLAVVIDTLKRDAEALGIRWQYKHIYYPSDGEGTDFPPPPDWRALLGTQCDRIGWNNAYAPLEASV